MSELAGRPMAGGPLCVDLVNTTWFEGDGPVDWLDNDVAVSAFSVEHQRSLAPDQVTAARNALIEARWLIRRAFSESTSLSSAVRDDFDRVLARASVHVVATEAGPVVSVSSADPSQALAVEAVVDAIELIGRQPDRIRSCQHDDCVLWFLDTSKGGRRRWCSMERCGNRVKARRHYAKTVTSGTDLDV